MKITDLLDEEHRPKLAVLVLIVCLLIFVIYSIYSQDEEIRVDEQTNCPIDDKHTQDYALVLLDSTSRIVGEYIQELEKKVRIIARSLPQYGKLSLHDITTGKKRLFMICAPKPPETGNDLTENPVKLERYYERDYLSKVDQAVQTFLANTSQTDASAASPILYTIANVTALSDFQKTENRNLYIFSDMLEHHGEYRHYRDLSKEEFEWLRKQNLYQDVKPKLSGARVHIYYLEQDTNRQFQSDNHKLFWLSYFRDAGVGDIVLENINLPGEKSAPPPMVITPRPQMKLPPPIARPAQSNKCDVAAVDKYRNSIVQSNGEDIQASYCLARLCEEGQIVGQESDSIIGKMKEQAFTGDNIPLNFRKSVAELYLRGLCGFKKSPGDAYVLLSCVGEKNTSRIHELRGGLYNKNLLDEHIKYMIDKNRCL